MNYIQRLSDSGSSQDDTVSAAYTAAFAEGFRNTVRFLTSKGIGEDLAEELAQAAWARGWERRDQIREISALPYWVNTIALNMLRRYVRSPANQTNELLDWEAAVSVNETVQCDARKILESCSQPNRKLLEMIYFEGFTRSEIGKSLGQKSLTVRVRLHRLLKSIRGGMAHNDR